MARAAGVTGGGETTVQCYLYPKAGGKVSVVVTNMNLPGSDSVEERCTSLKNLQSHPCDRIEILAIMLGVCAIFLANRRGHNLAGRKVTESTMPELSRFFGIVIGMYYREHGEPHFHASYGEHSASIEIESLRIHGSMPPRVERMVLEWARLHKAELIESWHRVRDRLPVVPIPPLE